jgi:Mg2+-importing ATPase
VASVARLLVLNLLYDFSHLSLPWDRMDTEFVRIPQKWDTTGIARFMVWIGPISSVFDITTFVLLWIVFHAKGPGAEAIFQSGWFIESLLSQALIVHMIRTEKIPFLQKPSRRPGAVTHVGDHGHRALSAVLPTGIGREHRAGFGWLVVTLLAYGALTQLVKTWYIRRFHAWLAE